MDISKSREAHPLLTIIFPKTSRCLYLCFKARNSKSHTQTIFSPPKFYTLRFFLPPQTPNRISLLEKRNFSRTEIQIRKIELMLNGAKKTTFDIARISTQEVTFQISNSDNFISSNLPPHNFRHKVDVFDILSTSLFPLTPNPHTSPPFVTHTRTQ